MKKGHKIGRCTIEILWGPQTLMTFKLLCRGAVVVEGGCVKQSTPSKDCALRVIVNWLLNGMPGEADPKSLQEFRRIPECEDLRVFAKANPIEEA